MSGSPEELERQLQLTRQFVAGTIEATDYIRRFLAIHYGGKRAPWMRETAYLAEWISDIWFDIDEHNEYDELRQPDEIDDDQLRERLTRHLAEWDAGEYEPDTQWKR